MLIRPTYVLIRQTLPLFLEPRIVRDRKENTLQFGYLAFWLVSFLFSACTIVWLDLIPDPSIAIRHLGAPHSKYSTLAVGNGDNETEVGIETAWYGLKGGEHCLRYATREYTAKLIGDPAATNQDMMKLCKSTPTVIHGRTLFTDFCQDLVGIF